MGTVWLGDTALDSVEIERRGRQAAAGFEALGLVAGDGVAVAGAKAPDPEHPHPVRRDVRGGGAANPPPTGGKRERAERRIALEPHHQVAAVEQRKGLFVLALDHDLGFGWHCGVAHVNQVFKPQRIARQNFNRNARDRTLRMRCGQLASAISRVFGQF